MQRNDEKQAGLIRLALALRTITQTVRKTLEAGGLCRFEWYSPACEEHHAGEPHMCKRLTSEHESLLHQCVICESE